MGKKVINLSYKRKTNYRPADIIPSSRAEDGEDYAQADTEGLSH
jgi:hypothetical protein